MNFTELDQFDTAVYQIATTDDVVGGPGGISNLQGQSLANRTRWLANRLAKFAVDTGSVDVYIADVSPAPTVLVDGMEVRVRFAHANDGPSTFTPNDALPISALPIVGNDHAALTGGEIVTNGEGTLRFNPQLNIPNGAWVLISSSGGTHKSITPAIGNAGTEVATMAAVFSATDGAATVNLAPGGGGDVTLTKPQYGSAILILSGTPAANMNLIFPAQTGVWVIINNQGGTNNVTLKTSSGTGKVAPQGVTSIIRCDGTNIDFASTAGQSAMRQIQITGITGTGPFAVTGGYTPGNILLEKNGSVLQPADYTASDSANFSLTVAAVSTDKFTVYAFSSFSVSGAVSKAGDTMTGALTLPGNATSALQAVPKQQLDAATRIRLTSNLTLFVSTTGSDSNSGLAVGTPFLTIQKAWNVIQQSYDLNGFTATIQLADGTYTSGLIANDPVVGAAANVISVIVNGNAATPANVIVSTGSSIAFEAQLFASFSIQNLQIRSTTFHVIASAMGLLQIGTGITFGVGAGSTHILATTNGVIICSSGYTISGSAATHWQSQIGGTININTVTITLSGTPAFSTVFANAVDASRIYCANNTFSGTATGTKFTASGNGVINTAGSGASYLPGSVAGTTATGGQYV